MRFVRRFAITAGLVGYMALSAFAQDKAGVTTIAKSKFQALPGLPACLTLSAQRGDPFKTAAVILIKMTAGCKVPWHWHTAGEGLMIVSGKGKIEMKEGDTPAAAVGPGDYVYLPGKHVHQFTCPVACTFFDVTEGAFDIHYVDKDGKEIPPEQALPPAKKPAAAGKPGAAKK
jgi:mannose-6-phosphate isomerase-like protein (cupin superfamily)